MTAHLCVRQLVPCDHAGGGLAPLLGGLAYGALYHAILSGSVPI